MPFTGVVDAIGGKTNGAHGKPAMPDDQPDPTRRHEHAQILSGLRRGVGSSSGCSERTPAFAVRPTI